MRQSRFFPLFLALFVVFAVAACSMDMNTALDDGDGSLDDAPPRVVALGLDADLSASLDAFLDCIEQWTRDDDDGPHYGGSGGGDPLTERVDGLSPCSIPLEVQACTCDCEDDDCLCYPCRIGDGGPPDPPPPRVVNLPVEVGVTLALNDAQGLGAPLMPSAGARDGGLMGRLLESGQDGVFDVLFPTHPHRCNPHCTRDEECYCILGSCNCRPRTIYGGGGGDPDPPPPQPEHPEWDHKKED